jgi:hypothetical protein
VARHLARIMIEGLILPTKATTDYFRIARYMPRAALPKNPFCPKTPVLAQNRSAQHDFRVLGFCRHVGDARNWLPLKIRGVAPRRKAGRLPRSLRQINH